MKRSALSACLATAILSSLPGHAHADRKASKDTAGPPAANARLHVTPGALGTSWTYEITNADTTPLRIVTDSRLLTLDVTPEEDDDSAHPAKRPTVVHCSLPTEVRPTTDAEHVHVLPPGETYVAEFDPRLYCFEGREVAALAPGSRVVARLGWPTRGVHLTPPFVADETFSHSTRTGVKELVADAVVTPDEFPTEDSNTGPQRLTVKAPLRIDAETGSNLQIEITVENVTSRPLHLMLRPETLAFEVASPKGVHSCGWSRPPGSAIAEVFTTIPPHGKASSSVLLASVCPDATFTEAGLYTVFPRIDTRHASGKSIGLQTFEGVVAADEPTLVRVRLPRGPRP